MKLKLFIISLMFVFSAFNMRAQTSETPTTEVQTPIEAYVSIDPMDFAVFSTGVDCYASGEYVLHAYSNRLDLYTSDGVMYNYELKSINFKVDSSNVVTKTYTTTSNAKFKVQINPEGFFGLKTPYDSSFKDSYQYEFNGILKIKLSEDAATGFYFPFTNFDKTQVLTPWGFQKIPPKANN